MKELQDTQLEKTLLGFLIENPKSLQIVKPVIENLDYFYNLPHQSIYSTILELAEDNVELDSLTIGNSLKKQGKLKFVGGYAYIASLSAEAPGKANIVYYAKLLKENYVERRVCEIAKNLYSNMVSKENYSTLNESIRKLQSLQASLGARKNKVRTVAEIVPRIFLKMEAACKDGAKPLCLPTGFENLDNYLGGGLYRSEFNIFAGRPSSGKTSMAVNIADRLSPEGKILLISLETTGESITRDRLLPLVSRVTSGHIRMPKKLDYQEWDRLSKSVGAFGAYKKFKICDQASMTMEDIESLVHQEKSASGGGFDLLIIDYLQLIVNKKRGANREQEVSEISKRLKALIKGNGLYSMVLSQLNRECEKQKREPQISDLRESGQLDQDADAIIFLHPYLDENDEERTKAIIAKNKNGACGKTSFYFDKRFTKFEELDKSGF